MNSLLFGKQRRQWHVQILFQLFRRYGSNFEDFAGPLTQLPRQVAKPY